MEQIESRRCLRKKWAHLREGEKVTERGSGKNEQDQGGLGDTLGKVTDQVGQVTQGVQDTAGQAVDQVGQTAGGLTSGLTQPAALQGKNLDLPDETRTFELGETHVVTLGDFKVTRSTLQPGWKWSEHVKPIAQTESCQVKHTGYMVSGRLHVAMDDGSAEREFGAGDAYVIPPGHDAWVVSVEPCVVVDVSAETAEKFAKEG